MTLEEQKILDQKYEDLMYIVKEKDLSLYKRLRANEQFGFQKDLTVVENNDKQLEMVL
tara:strand:- start:4976 stop:5149 length:174 start_codon:yes stop_codon:yes gene_type:complete